MAEQSGVKEEQRGMNLLARIRKTLKTQLLIMILKLKCVFLGIEPEMNEASNVFCLAQFQSVLPKKQTFGEKRPQTFKRMSKFFSFLPNRMSFHFRMPREPLCTWSNLSMCIMFLYPGLPLFPLCFGHINQ